MPYTIIYTLISAFETGIALRGGLGHEPVWFAIVFAALAGLGAILYSYRERER